MNNKSNIVEALSMVTQIGLNMLVSIFLCLAIGSWVDNKFGTNLMIFFIAFGIISGYCGAYSTLKRLVERMSGHREEEDFIYAQEDDLEDESNP